MVIIVMWYCLLYIGNYCDVVLFVIYSYFQKSINNGASSFDGSLWVGQMTEIGGKCVIQNQPRQNKWPRQIMYFLQEKSQCTSTEVQN